MRTYLVEQDPTELYGEYLAQAMAVAISPAAAIAGVKTHCTQCGIGVLDERLKVYDFGEAPPGVMDSDESPLPIYLHPDCCVYVLQSAQDDDGQTGYPNLEDAEE